LTFCENRLLPWSWCCRFMTYSLWNASYRHTRTHIHTQYCNHSNLWSSLCMFVTAASTSSYQTISIQFQLILSIDNVFYTNIDVPSLRMTHKGSKHVLVLWFVKKKTLYCNMVRLLVFSWITCRISHFLHILDLESQYTCLIKNQQDALFGCASCWFFITQVNAGCLVEEWVWRDSTDHPIFTGIISVSQEY
jgi:hypothetical protein